MMNKDEILVELGENYNFLGESLYLLTALMAYESAFDTEGKEEVAETSRACFHRLSNDLDQCAKEILSLSAALLRQE